MDDGIEGKSKRVTSKNNSNYLEVGIVMEANDESSTISRWFGNKNLGRISI